MILFAGNITHLTDARYFSAWNVDWMGYQFDPMVDKALDYVKFEAIKEWVEGPETVIECGIVDADNLSDIVAETSASLVKMHPLQDPLFIKDAIIGVAKLIAHFIVEPNTKISDWKSFESGWDNLADYVIIDLAKNKLDPRKEDFIEEILDSWSTVERPIISWPLGVDIDKQWLEESNVGGLYISGDPEDKIGMKEYVVLDEILEKFAWDD